MTAFQLNFLRESEVFKDSEKIGLSDYYLTMMEGQMYGAYAKLGFPIYSDKNKFVQDNSTVLSIEEKNTAEKIISKLLSEKNIPIVVVTLNSLGEYTANNVSLSQYSIELFNHWGIGSVNYNYGILLLLTTDDGAVNITLGKAWPDNYDVISQNIVDSVIAPKINRNEMASGIMDGLAQLENMAREIPVYPMNVEYGPKGNIGDAITAYVAFIFILLAIGLCAKKDEKDKEKQKPPASEK
ncbi:MAG: TPM domain-containing protein [Cellvibrionaceae bacterium]